MISKNLTSFFFALAGLSFFLFPVFVKADTQEYVSMVDSTHVDLSAFDTSVSFGTPQTAYCSTVSDSYKAVRPSTANSIGPFICAQSQNANFDIESQWGSNGDGTYWTKTDKYLWDGNSHVNDVVLDIIYLIFYRTGGVWTTDVLETCNDGILNQDETAIDIGGVCTQTISSNITTSTTWGGGVTYVISDDIEITSGDTLIIEPGTVLKFDNTTSSSLTVNGTLTAVGDEGSETASGKIIFTSLADDVKDDTNEDGDTTQPAGGDWGGIEVGSGGVASFEYAIIRYAGKTGTSEAQIYNNGGTVNVANSIIVYGTDYGIKNTSGTTAITESSDIGFNDQGIHKAGGTVTVSDSVIHDNASYGIYNGTSSVIDAEDNYWGDSTGPDGFGPGSGDNVSDYVDFTPWVENLHYISDEFFPIYCDDKNECTSVYADKLEWKNIDVTSYTTELSSALSTWDALGTIDIVEDNSTPTVELYEVGQDDVSWAAKWIPEESPDQIKLNSFYLNENSSNQIQNTITHEIGHALGLWHSYTGNIMYYAQTSQTSLGFQDAFDYYYLWP